MMRFRRHIGHFFTLVAVFGFFGVSAWGQSNQPQNNPVTLTFAGSGVNLEITRFLASAFMQEYPQVTIDVPGSIGSKGAITAVAEGAVPLGLISRPLKNEEKNLGIVSRPYAQVAMVIGVHPTVQETEISSAELIEIIAGSRSRWRDGREIIVQVREKFDSGFQLLEKKIPGFQKVYWQSLEDKRWTVSFTDQEANKALAKTPYALGVTDFGMISTENLNIKVLKFNGIFPSPENLANGSYPLIRQLEFIYRQSSLPEHARLFLDFVFSDKGAAILKKYNYLALQ